MLKVIIANDMNSYKLGKSDGIIFTDVSQEDLSTINDLAVKYNKQVDVITLKDIKHVTETPIVSSIEDKRKIKKIFINNGKETIKITPDKLPEYMAKGYRTGRKK